MKKTNYISDLHFEHVHWNNELSFQRDILRSFRKRLEEVSPKYTDKDVKSHVEQFQNQFIRQFEVLDTLQHDIKIHEQELAQFAKDHPIAIDHIHFSDHEKLRDDIETQRHIFKDLNDEYLRFLTKVM